MPRNDPPPVKEATTAGSPSLAIATATTVLPPVPLLPSSSAERRPHDSCRRGHGADPISASGISCYFSGASAVAVGLLAEASVKGLYCNLNPQVCAYAKQQPALDMPAE